MEIEQDLRAVSDSLLVALDRIQDLEQRKRAELPGTPNFVALARQVEELAQEILRRSERQEGLARETAEMRAVGEAPERPIEDMPAAVAPEPAASAAAASGAAASAAAASAGAASREAAPLRDLALILRDWRDAERRLADAPPDSAEAREAAADSRRLRDEYARGYAAREQRS